VPGGRVLIIEGDEWESTLLKKFLEEAGYTAEIATGAREGLEKARAQVPDCILCDAVLPDIDGFWVARRLRMEPNLVATIPLVLLVASDDQHSRWQGLTMGADTCVAKPYTAEEVTAQVAALVGMVERIRRTQQPLFDYTPSVRVPDAFHGDISQLSVSTTLSILEMERRTGTLKVTSDHGQAVLELADGALLQASVAGRVRDPLSVMREVLKWNKGRFSFLPTKAHTAKGARLSLGALMLEALRLEDEESGR
jgi:two-component system, OmpR family, response regulator